VFGPEVYKADPNEDYTHDVVFVGGGKTYAHKEWPYRAQLATWLEDTYGDRYAKYGYPEKLVRGFELNKLYSNTKIVVGDSLCKDFIDSYYWSDRIYETIGRGGFIIHPYIPGITDHFVDRKEAVFYSYGNWTQLKNLIDYYLEHDDEREAIRTAGRHRVLAEHTYRHRVQEMLHVLRAEGAIK
jgi:spore maturation protein CgeB